MGILTILIALSIVFLVVAVGFFFWATGDGQFDDLDSPAIRILMDDDSKPLSKENSSKSND